MKKVITAIICLILAVSLAGCGKYISSYKAVGFVHSNEKTSAFMSFISFDGTMVFKLKSSGESSVKCSAKLESGNAAVYFDCNGTRTELLSLQGGDNNYRQSESVAAGTVYVIVETDGICQNGEIRFSLE